jgi:hypothetical protein
MALIATALSAAELRVDSNSTAAAPNGSTAAPFKTISAALQTARPGDTVVIHGGTYREHLAIPSGDKDHELTIKAASGERVIVSGSKRLAGWKKHSDTIWMTTLDERPERLIVNSHEQPIAREPKESWWELPSCKNNVVTDPAHLKDFPFDVRGAEICVWQASNRFPHDTVKGLDKATGTLSLVGKGKFSSQTRAKDRYYLRNNVTMIDRPGEWATESTGDKYTIYFRPADPADLERVEAPTAGHVVELAKVGHVTIDGLEICGSEGRGINVMAAHDLHITHCVIHHNQMGGLQSAQTQRIHVSRCVLWCNFNGLELNHDTSDAVAEENDIGYNVVDGIHCTEGSHDIVFRHNYIHDHYFLGHPDNIQVWGGVENLQFLDNVLLNGGQAFMMAEATNGVIEGNMIAGTAANMVIFGHESVGRFKVRRNTIAYTGAHCLNITYKDYDVRENVFVTGNGNVMFDFDRTSNYTGDHNLFWNIKELSSRGLLGYDGHRFPALEEFQKASGQEQHSAYADPRFVHAPVSFAKLDEKRNHLCTADTWYILEGAGLFHEGDIIDLHFDGVPRKVIKVQPETITVSPGLKAKPARGLLIANWGKNSGNLKLDLRLRDDSPALRLGADGGRIGSTLDIEAYRAGDFHGDGRRDRAEIPQELLEAVQSL